MAHNARGLILPIPPAAGQVPRRAARVRRRRAVSSTSIDLHDKLDVYRHHGVQEYIVWRVYDQAIDWFALVDAEYRRLEPDERGIVRSRVFPGLCLDVHAMLQGGLATVLAVQRDESSR